MFMAGPVYPLSAVTAGPSRIARFSSSEYVSMLRESPETCLRMLGHLSQRLHMRIREIEYLTLESATHRLVRMIEGKLPPGDRRPGGNPVPGVAAGDCFTALHEARDAVAHPPPAFRCRRHHRAGTDPAGAQPRATDLDSRLRDLTDDEPRNPLDPRQGARVGGLLQSILKNDRRIIVQDDQEKSNVPDPDRWPRHARLAWLTAPLAATLASPRLPRQPSSSPQVHQAEVAAGAAPSAERIKAGEEVFKVACIACHQETGLGMPGAFPPLAKSDFLLVEARSCGRHRRARPDRRSHGQRPEVQLRHARHDATDRPAGRGRDHLRAQHVGQQGRQHLGRARRGRARRGGEGRHHRGVADAAPDDGRRNGVPGCAVAGRRRRRAGAHHAGGADHDHGRVRPGAEDLLPALRGLSRRAAQGGDGQAAHARHHPTQGHRVPEGLHQPGLARGHAELGQVRRAHARSRWTSWRGSCSRRRRSRRNGA